jgi:hypothetical protein
MQNRNKSHSSGKAEHTVSNPSRYCYKPEHVNKVTDCLFLSAMHYIRPVIIPNRQRRNA